MSDAGHYKILSAVPEDESGLRLDRTCRANNWSVTRVTSPQMVMEALEDTNSYHLFIADTRLKNFDVIDVLIQSRHLSPVTRRLLIIEKVLEKSKGERLLKAVNDARVNGLIPAGHAHEELVRQAGICLEAASKEQKRARLEEATSYQNKQMFKIAQRLKNKEAGLKERVQALKKERIRISSRLQAAFQQKKDPSSLGSRMDAYAIPVTAEALSRQFSQLARSADILFQNIAMDIDIEPLDILLGRLFDPDSQKSSTQESVDSISDPALEPIKGRIMRTLYASPENSNQFSSSFEPEQPFEKRDLPDLVTITTSPDRVHALISLKSCSSEERDAIKLAGILDLLRIKEIRFGIVDDQAIESWITTVQPADAPFEIATGTPPVHGEDGKVTYRFETNYTNPGKIMDDGRIDFRNRGAIPFVHQGDLVAEKIPARPGRDGVSVCGDPIEVEEPLDPVFLAGPGTRVSEDGLSIHADTDGHPHLDPMGEISVNPELNIDGDIDFSTGNIDFKGHIVISGRVREGFSVKGVSLTAREVEGAAIELSGDLCVSDGITDTQVASVGNIYAKFINNSTANAFGDIVIQKEIIDSQLLLSGTCQNPGGTVMGSKIAARNGVEAGRIGTPASKPSQIRTGVEDHIRFWQEQLDSELNMSMGRMQEVKDDIEALEDQDQEIYAVIAIKSREQEKISADIEKNETELAEYRRLNDQKAVSLAMAQQKSLSARLKEIDQVLNECFESHDKNLKELEEKKKALEETLACNKAIMLKKRGLKEFHMRTGHQARVLAQQGITQGTVIMGPHTSLTLETDQGRCKIQELSVNDEVGSHFELIITDP